MLVREERKPPEPWRDRRARMPHRWALPFQASEWAFDRLAYQLSQWAFLEVLEYLSALSVLVAVVFYFAESGDRRKQKHYQAWEVINTAQGKGGSGGRIEALQELNADHQPLVGLDAPGAFLQGVQLSGANLLRCNLEATDLRNSHLAAAEMAFGNLRSANFRSGDLGRAHLKDADLEDADLVGASLAGADLSGANLDNADLRNTDLAGTIWRDIKSIQGANIYGVRNPPAEFLAWALSHGARSAAGGPE
jgi:Pentapeptide repeats (8 copies)